MITTLIENVKNIHQFPHDISGKYFEECYKVYEELNVIKINYMDYGLFITNIL
jgi:hypothetical protein